MPKRFIVSPSEGGEGDWMVQEEGGGEATTVGSQEEAIRKGEEMARREKGMLVIQDEDGRFQETRGYTEEGGQGGGQGGGGR